MMISPHPPPPRPAQGCPEAAPSQPPSFSLLGQAACYYAGRGWRVFPLVPGGKVPLIKGGHGCLDATCDLRQVERWWRRFPQANIGIATGAESNLFVLDFDFDHGGLESRRQMEEQFEALPRTLVARSGSGGLHLYYRYPRDAGATLTVSQGLHDQFPGIDSRGEGGYIVAPFSVHPSGALYEWADWRAPAEIPPWLVALLSKKEQQQQPVVPSRSAPPFSPSLPSLASRQRLIEHIVEETVRRACVGNRNQHGMILAVILRERDIPEGEARAAMRQYAWRVPQVAADPYTEAEALNTFERVYFSRRR